MIISTKHDVQHYLADPSTHDEALAYLQSLMDERYNYRPDGSWGIITLNGLTRLDLTTSEAVALGAEDRVVPEPAGPSLEMLKAAKAAEIEAGYAQAVSVLKARYPEDERATWSQQVADAQALAADPQAAAPLIRAMAANRPSLGATEPERVTALAQAILANAAAWSASVGAATGKMQALRDALETAQTPQAVAAIAVVY